MKLINVALQTERQKRRAAIAGIMKRRGERDNPEDFMEVNKL